MSAQSNTKPTETRRPLLASLPRIAVRERTPDNQMAMFSFISVAALAVMMLLPSPRAAFGAVETETPAIAVATEKTGRLPVQTDADRACEGQVWGSEKLDCILAIAKESGLTRTVRLADAGLRQ